MDSRRGSAAASSTIARMDRSTYVAVLDRVIEGGHVLMRAEGLPLERGQPADALPHNGHDYVRIGQMQDGAVLYVAVD